MSDFITLSCPSCGAKLQITSDIERFSCSNCGQEHLIKRSGAKVSLAPIASAINNVRTGVDKTAAELAIVRLQNEISNLKAERDYYIDHFPQPTLNNSFIVLILVGLGGCALSFIELFISNYNDLSSAICFIIILPDSIIAIIISIVQYFSFLKEKSVWKETIGKQLAELAKAISQRRDAMEHNRKIVNSLKGQP